MGKPLIEYILDFIEYVDSWRERYPTTTNIVVGLVGAVVMITVGIVFFYIMKVLGIDFSWIFAIK